MSFHKGDQVYEVIDGQQRLTTINIILKALDAPISNKLTYRARKKSNDTIQSMPLFNVDELDSGIVNGFEFAKDAISEKVPRPELDAFKHYFQTHVYLIHYQVPKDIDLNHYFEIMNSRGEQLEKHEIIKARLLEKLNDTDKAKFNQLWESCSEMNVYIQQKYQEQTIFGHQLSEFKVTSFDDLPQVNANENKLKISDLLELEGDHNYKKLQKEDKIDSFQPIIDFPNFLLIVLKLTRIKENAFIPENLNLDDKDLIQEFDKIKIDEQFTKTFGFNLLKAKYLLDNYIVHHTNDDETIEHNPWKLQYWQKDGNIGLKNRDDSDLQPKLVQLLSMFEVSFTAKQRKNYLFYCLCYLFTSFNKSISLYYTFLSDLADKYFKDVYLMASKLNEINTPKAGSFDKTIIVGNELNTTVSTHESDFSQIYGDGTSITKGIPLFIFNYLDYKLWAKYADEIRGKSTNVGDPKRAAFFNSLGCSDFGLKPFDDFYFSRTRRSLEHFFPQAEATGQNGLPNQEQINCFGNFAMIGSSANSSGSNWRPITKINHYLDASGKVKQVSIASPKLLIMMQKCKDNQHIGDSRESSGKEWVFEDIKEHQEKMLALMLN